jgi:predicted Co/Zn/Cd cation transporter (cation efflux family)
VLHHRNKPYLASYHAV